MADLKIQEAQIITQECELSPGEVYAVFKLRLSEFNRIMEHLFQEQQRLFEVDFYDSKAFQKAYLCRD